MGLFDRFKKDKPKPITIHLNIDTSGFINYWDCTELDDACKVAIMFICSTLEQYPEYRKDAEDMRYFILEKGKISERYKSMLGSFCQSCRGVKELDETYHLTHLCETMRIGDYKAG